MLKLKVMRQMKIVETINGVSKESQLQEFVDDYFISEYLNVYSIKSSKLKQIKIRRKTMKVGYYVNAEHKEDKVHYIAARTFIPNSEGRQYVIFKDGNSANKHVSNLAWSENKTVVFNKSDIRKQKIGEYINVKGEKILKEVDLLSTDYKGYFVSEYSKIYSKKSGLLKEVTIYKRKSGIEFVRFSLDGVKNFFDVNNIVLKAFFPDEQEQEYALFKDGNMNNKHYTNLIWSSQPEIEDEEFKPIPGFSKYKVPKQGICKSYFKKEIIFMKPLKNELGYFHFQLRADDGKKYSVKRHRLVALAFLPNPENKPHVDHIDRIPGHDHLDNLKWSTISENALNKDFEEIGKKTRKHIMQYDLDGNFLQEFKSGCEAGAYLENNHNIKTEAYNLKNCALKNKDAKKLEECCTSAGFIWIYQYNKVVYSPEKGEVFENICKDFGDKFINFPSYKISNYGTVINKRGFRLKHDIFAPYPAVQLYENGVSKTTKLHTLVALFFCKGRTKEKCIVNHKDENNKNFHFTNLEWVTRSENALYSSYKIKKPIDQFDPKTGIFVARFPSATDYSKLHGNYGPRISLVCTSLKGTANGYIWRFADLTKSIPDPIVIETKKETGKKVDQFDLKGKYIATHDSIAAASRAIGKGNKGESGISHVCNGYQDTSAKFIWKFSNKG